MIKIKVYAIIISYNGDYAIIDAIQSIRSQVDKVIVVDNASSATTLKILAELECMDDIHLIRLDDNYGIAHAQNVGIAVGYRDGADWVLTLDQDSVCAEDMVAKLLVAGVSLGTNRLGFCCPAIKNQALGQTMRHKSGVEVVQYAISSGCLFPMTTLQAVGNQRADYFIDSVDFEFCLRMSSQGYRLIRVNNAMLDHKLGIKRNVKIFGANFSLSIHAPFRRYYLFRNHIFLVRSYWRQSPIFLLKKSLFLFFLFLQIVVFEDKKKENIRQCFFGLLDGLRGRRGKNMRVVHG